MRLAAACLLALALAACQSDTGTDVPGDTSETLPYAGVDERETLHFTGTEPFWGGRVTGGRLTYSTPENQDGAQIAVNRFAGRGGLSYSGTFAGKAFDLAVTETKCSDGMSDRTYPFAVTLKVTGETRSGCAWTDARSFTGSERS